MKGNTVTHKDYKAICVIPPVLDVLQIKLQRRFVVQGEYVLCLC